LDEAVAQAAAAPPDRPVEVWAEDEHRLGLKPVRRRVWAPVGAPPVALGHHRYQWLHVVAVVQPTSGEAVWYLCSGLSKPFFAERLATFARETGAGGWRSIVLVLDNAGWHGPENLAVPDGISLVFLPPYSPELQPAERLWSLVDEPIVNRHVASLDELTAVIAERCRRLDAATLEPHTKLPSVAQAHQAELITRSWYDTSLAVVAPGIAEALFATAIGLVAAIPAVVAYNRYSHDIDRLATRFESFMEEFSNILHRQAVR